MPFSTVQYMYIVYVYLLFLFIFNLFTNFLKQVLSVLSKCYSSFHLFNLQTVKKKGWPISSAKYLVFFQKDFNFSIFSGSVPELTEAAFKKRIIILFLLDQKRVYLKRIHRWETRWKNFRFLWSPCNYPTD